MDALQRIARTALLAALAASTSVDARSQNALRGWDRSVYDTDAYTMPITAISAAGYATAVLRADGRIYVHGAEIGFGGRCRPPDPPPGLRFVSVSLGAYHGLGILSDGSAMGWGSGTNSSPPPPPAPPAGTRYLQVSAGDDFALGLRSDGVVLGWTNVAGSTVLTVPPPLPSGATVRSVFAGGGWSLLLLSTGEIVVWGTIAPVPPLPPGTQYVEVFAGPDNAFARRSDGVVVGWGQNTFSQLTLPPLPPGVSFAKLAPGTNHTLALRSDGTLVAWGDNSHGQCDLTPLPPGRSVADISAGALVSLVLLDDGSVVGWGGRYLEAPLPVLLPGERWTSVACGYYNALGVTSSGRLVGIGPDFTGMLSAPVLPPGVRYVRAAAGWQHSAALRSDGRLVTMGRNRFGERYYPPLPTGMTYVDVAVSESHTVAVRSDGNAFAFGLASFGGLAIPAPPPGLRYVRADAAYGATMLLRSDGVAVCVGGGSGSPGTLPLPAGLTYVDVAVGPSYWTGLRSDGQVTYWSSGLYPFPLPPAGTAYVEISGGEHHVLARRSDGQIVVFAGNSGENRVLPLRAGESYVEIDAQSDRSATRVGPTSTYVAFANGCAGSLPAARLVPRDTPRIGSTLEVTLFDLPASAAFMVFGWDRRQPGPLALDPMGMPGCSLHASLDAVTFWSGTNQQARFRLPIPDWPGLIGMRFVNQAVVLDPAANAMGAVMSDAAEGIVGDQ